VNRAPRLALVATAAAFALPGLGASAASADQIVTPAKYDFGALPIGATSATVPLTLTATCDTAHMCAPQPFHTAIASASSEFAVVSEDCPDEMPGADMAGTSCTISVRFTPAVVGPRGATVATGNFIPIPPGPPENGTQGELLGSGICSPSVCFPGYFPGPNPQTLNSGVPEPTSSSRKKC
jgi:hypothetical protein